MASYGAPYMGSKDGICDQIIKLFPKAKHFYDLFGGGFSVTHAMLLRRSRDYEHFYFNEIREGLVDLIQQAIRGEFSYDTFRPKWIGKEEFFKRVMMAGSRPGENHKEENVYLNEAGLRRFVPKRKEN